MANDILLEAAGHSDWIAMQAPVVQFTSHDVLIDSAERRKSATPFRRALVHDQADGLTLNFANDYPGGITLNGVTSITPNATATPGPVGQLTPGLPAVAVHGDITYEQVGVALIGGGRPRITTSLTQEINALRELIRQLSERVTALEAK